MVWCERCTPPPPSRAAADPKAGAVIGVCSKRSPLREDAKKGLGPRPNQRGGEVPVNDVTSPELAPGQVQKRTEVPMNTASMEIQAGSGEHKAKK